MATKSARGTKRTCQSNECGARFYDLNRDPIVCPICGSIYQLASAPLSAVAEDKQSRKPKRTEFADEAGAETPAAEGEEALVDLEGDAGVAAEEDETFLEEEEEDGGDMSNIIGDVAEGEEEV